MNYLKCLFRYFQFFLNVYLLTCSETETRITNTKRSAEKCGPLGIKLLQFLIMRNIFKTKRLNIFLENCDIHTFQQTQQLYFKDFEKTIEEDFTELEIIGSGSIGQVYKGYNIALKKYIAIKVKHPDINSQIIDFSKALRLILKLFFNWKLKYLISEFINNINTQLDYNLEAANTIKFKKQFENEPLIMIPEIYHSTDNFIFMEYIPGQPFEECTNKKMISMYIQYIFMISVLVYDFLHGDLHFGNWKVNENRVVIYDCGIMYQSNDLELNKKLMTYIFNGNYKNLLTLFNPSQEKKIEKVIRELELLDNETAGNRIQNFLTLSINNKLIKDKYLIDLLNCAFILGETKKISVDIYTKYIFVKGDSNAIMFYTHIDLLNKMGIFKDLKTFFEKWTSEDPENKIVHNNWLMENFGHTDSTIISDIIYEKLIS